MASNPDQAPPAVSDESESPATQGNLPVDNEIVEPDQPKPSTVTDEERKDPVNDEEKQAATTTTTESGEEPQVDQSLSSNRSDQKEESVDSLPSTKVPKEKPDHSTEGEESKASPLKSRSVNFTATEEEIDVPKPRSTNSSNARSSSSSYKSSRRPVDFVDTLVESYKLETSKNEPSITEGKKYVPKTSRTRLNPNWREHRTRRLMNKLEELSLWDREEELKASQAQQLREQKWEQIQDRQRNNDLCLNLMRQRHESEMESAVLLDRGANNVNDENTSATIAHAMKIASPANALAYDLPSPPSTLRRRAKQQTEDAASNLKTPIGRFRQFETNMDEKVEKINQKLQPDREIMRAYSPHRTSIPATVVPLFSETYSTLLSLPDSYPSNKYNQYHYGVASYLHQPHHAASPDYETRLRGYSNRDVRVPLKEQANDYNYYDDDSSSHYNRSTAGDDDYYPSKYRPTLHEDDYLSKYRPNLHDDDYSSKYRSVKRARWWLLVEVSFKSLRRRVFREIPSESVGWRQLY